MLYDPLFAYIESKSSSKLNNEEKQLVQQTFKAKHLRKRQYLLQEGDVCKYMAFVVKGAGRMYSVNESGQEIIIRFGIESWWLGDYESYNLHTPSLYNIDMIEDSDLLLISNEQLQQLLKRVPAIDLMIREIDRKGAIATQKRIHSAISLGAEERYNQLVKTYPELLLRFPQGMIASYLGISPETLSRIRKNALHK
jgi:CRP/FNR family transcriptional regulator, anaerobic regulatory protein